MATASLFARKLRAWRATAGRNGRMTQEALAEMLGVSVDAIGKYERSVSFIRGDLEPRLSDALGWSREDILACREDWEIRQHARHGRGYRLLDQSVLDEAFGGSLEAAIVSGLDMADAEFGELPEAFAPSRATFVPMYMAVRDHWAMVLEGDRIVAKWALPFLLPEDEALFRAGEYRESDMKVDRLRRALLPGEYFGYCPALVVRAGHEAASPLLLSSFVTFLEGLARRDIYLGGIGTVSCTAAGAQVCRELGMTYLGGHKIQADFGVWVLEGAAIAGSVFGRRSPSLRRRYDEAFAAQDQTDTNSGK